MKTSSTLNIREMQKRELLNLSKSFLTKTDGYYYIMSASNFLGFLRVERVLAPPVIKAHPKAGILNPIAWKRELAELTQQFLSMHGDVSVVLVKQPTPQGNLDNYLFDGFVFNNISLQMVQQLRIATNEGGRGLFVNYGNIQKMAAKTASPYYVRLVPIPQNASLAHGMLILKKYY